MCPRTMITDPTIMDAVTFDQTLKRIDPRDAFRCIIAGYGEPTTHPRCDDFIEAIRAHLVTFDMATNGSCLGGERLQQLDGALGALMISFSSVDPDVYRRVHANLDQDEVMENIVAARALLRKTRLVINLSPTLECLDTLEETILWFHRHDIRELHMSPTYYDRAGAIRNPNGPDHTRLRECIRRYHLKSQEMAFIPSTLNIIKQTMANRFRCIPRNVSLMISANGYYTFCFNDIRHSALLGHVSEMSLREALEERQRRGPVPEICDHCNLRDRYRPRELARVAYGYVRQQLAAASH
jgi:MoaA/NifB/PqqE/SkfB family radical SAM enzyme